MESAGGYRAVELRAFGEAVAHFRELVSRLDRLNRRVDAARVRERLGNALISAGQFAPAMRALETAETLYRDTNSIEGLARVFIQQGQVFGLRGKAPEGLSYLLPQVEQLERQGLSAAGQAALLVALGHLLTACSRTRELLSVSERAIQLAREAGDARLEGRATMRRGIALAALARLDEASEAFDLAVGVSERTGDLWNLSISLSNQAHIFSRRGELDRARRRIEEARASAERFGGVSMIVLRWCESGQIAFQIGEWREARKDLERALGLLGAPEENWTTAYAQACLGELSAIEGQTNEARSLLERAIRFTERSGDLQILRHAQRVAAELDLVEGRAALACARLEPLYDDASEQEADVIELLPVLALSKHALRDDARAIALAERSIALARAASMQRALSDGLRARAYVAAQARDWSIASSALAEALNLDRSMRAPYGEAKTRYGLGLLSAERGAADVAREHFTAALANLERLGEGLYANHVRNALAMLDAGDVTMTVPHSARERRA